MSLVNIHSYWLHKLCYQVELQPFNIYSLYMEICIGLVKKKDEVRDAYPNV